MPVEFLTDAQAATYGCYSKPPSAAELDRCFLLDDKACGLIESKRLPHTRLGYAVQLTTLLFIGRFLADPTDVPTEVVDYLAGSGSVWWVRRIQTDPLPLDQLPGLRPAACRCDPAAQRQ